jgi:ribosome biogenesis GTPase A
LTVQWFPGHMAKAKRELIARLPQVDMVVEIADARVAAASRNPDLVQLISGKLHLLVLNKADLASPPVTDKWLQVIRKKGMEAVAFSALFDRRQKLLRPIQRLAAKNKAGIKGDLKILVVGVPNVGKSAVINKLARRRSAAVGARPGVTRAQQWIRVEKKIMIMDTPGILWPKFEQQQTGYKLAAVGAIREEILPLEEVALWLGQELIRRLPFTLETTFDLEDTAADAILSGIARRRGLYISKGQLDLERAAGLLLREFQQGKLGRVSLDDPGEEII